MGLARMDMTLVEDMGKQVGEFDFDVVDDILTLISRLAPVIKSISSNETDGDDNNSKSSKSTNNMTLRNTTSTHHCNACNGQQCTHTCGKKGKKSKKNKKNYSGGRGYYKPLVPRFLEVVLNILLPLLCLMDDYPNRFF